MRISFLEGQCYLFCILLSIVNISTADQPHTVPNNIGNNYFQKKPIPHKQPEKPLDNSGNAETEIGNNYFENTPNSKKKAVVRTISQVGAAYEARQNMSDVYLFLNQLLPNKLFYEFRAYGIYNYLYRAPPSVQDLEIHLEDERHQVGYGGSGTLGYNINISPRVSVLPFVRVQAITNFIEVYADVLGNKINSFSYGGFLGARLALRVTEDFAVYTQYFAGYLWTPLTGQGAFAITEHAQINLPTSVFEFGTPYKITERLNFTPYLQFTTAAVNPNQAAKNSPFNVRTFVNTNTFYAVKFGYQF